MDTVLDFAAEVNAAMLEIAEAPRTLFLGQSVAYDGARIHASLEGVPNDKRMEMPVVEDFQLGFSIGLALAGVLPICIYPRIDFMLLAMNQLVNHLDRIEEMGDFRPKVIIRTTVGARVPFNAGPQHTGNYVEPIRAMLRHVNVVELREAKHVRVAYRAALRGPHSFLFVENPC